MKNTTIEILLASYNGEKYIREQIDSILAQTNEQWHLTVSDDGSTDHTESILNDYVNRFPEKIARVHSGRKFGNARDHFFWLIDQCEAEYMITCDQDDRWYTDKTQKMLVKLQEAEKEYGKEMPILVFSDQTPTDAQLKPLAPSLMRYQNQFFEYFDYRSLLIQNVVTGGAMGFNRALVDLAMQCRNPEKTIMHDWWMAVVAARFGRIVYIDESLGDYRQHGTNSVGAKNVRSPSYILNKFSQMKAIRIKNCAKKLQARVFIDTYALMLNCRDQEFLYGFVKDRSGPGFYWKYRKLIHDVYRLAGMMVLG